MDKGFYTVIYWLNFVLWFICIKVRSVSSMWTILSDALFGRSFQCKNGEPHRGSTISRGILSWRIFILLGLTGSRYQCFCALTWWVYPRRCKNSLHTIQVLSGTEHVRCLLKLWVISSILWNNLWHMLENPVNVCCILKGWIFLCLPVCKCSFRMKFRGWTQSSCPLRCSLEHQGVRQRSIILFVFQWQSFNTTSY